MEITRLEQKQAARNLGQSFGFSQLTPEQQTAIERTRQAFTPKELLDKVENFVVDHVISKAVENNKIINPQAIKDINIEEFFKQAETELAPYYKQQFDSAKEDLFRGFSQIGVDLGLASADITRQKEQAQLTGREQLAGRGLTFSGKRNTFETNISQEAQRQQEAKRTLAFRGAADIGRQTERQVGSDRFTQFGQLPTIGGEQAFAPQGDRVGTLVQQRRTGIQALGRARANDEAKRLAFA